MEVVIRDGKGRAMSADLHLSANMKADLVIFCHGFKGFKDWGHFNLLPARFTEAGMHFLKFNFSHNGGNLEQVMDFPDLEAFSENNYSKELEDISRVVGWTESEGLKHFGEVPGRLFLIGHSRGGAMAILAASRNEKIKKLVTWAAVCDLDKRFPSGQDLEKWRKDGVTFIKNSRTGQDMPIKFQFYEDFMAHKDDLDVVRAEKKLRIPHLLLHGTMDESVYLGESVKLMSLNENAKLIKLHGAGHTFGAYHPFDKSSLPKDAELAVQHSISFLQDQ